MDNNKDNNVWFITGGSQGFGLYLTRLVLSNGDKVAATTRNTDRLLENLSERPKNLLPISLDITSDQKVKQAIDETVETFDGLDIVVNNAGYSLVGSMEEMTDKEFRATMDVNLFGTVNVIRHAMPYLRGQQSGHIINMSSNAGYVGIGKAASYNAAKFGLIGLSEALAQEVSDFGIDVTVVAPGQFRTNFMDTIHYVEHRIPAYGVSEDEKHGRSLVGVSPVILKNWCKFWLILPRWITHHSTCCLVLIRMNWLRRNERKKTRNSNDGKN